MNSAMADARSRRNEPERRKSQHRYGSGRWSKRLSLGSRTMDGPVATPAATWLRLPYPDPGLPSQRGGHNAWKASMLKGQTVNRLGKKAKRGFRGYPVATIAFYGPDNKKATKVAVAIVLAAEQKPGELRRWLSHDRD